MGSIALVSFNILLNTSRPLEPAVFYTAGGIRFELAEVRCGAGGLGFVYEVGNGPYDVSVEQTAMHFIPYAITTCG